jgi:NAD+ diphosphatase
LPTANLPRRYIVYLVALRKGLRATLVRKMFASRGNPAKVRPMLKDILPPNAPITFAGNPIDRGERFRHNPDKIAELMVDPSSRFVAFHRLQPLLEAGDVAYTQWLSYAAVKDQVSLGAAWVFLGLLNDEPHFAVDISRIRSPETNGPVAGLGVFMDMRAAAGQLDPTEAGILAQGKALIDWHNRHQFCAVCGHETEMKQAGMARHCTDDNCKAQHFPRTDPVAIMLAIHEDKCLLGRQSMFPPKMFSALAGFVEPGETFEDCARREVWEEAGIKVGEVKYHSNQPWPFPGSLMIGCHCEALTTEIDTSLDELEDAQWFEKDLVRAALSGKRSDELWMPPPFAIAHQLVRAWALA